MPDIHTTGADYSTYSVVLNVNLKSQNAEKKKFWGFNFKIFCMFQVSVLASMNICATIPYSIFNTN